LAGDDQSILELTADVRYSRHDPPAFAATPPKLSPMP
jgi:hypothetical protein